MIRKIYSCYFLPGKFLNGWIDETNSFIIELIDDNKYRIIPNKIELVGKHPYHKFIFNNLNKAKDKLKEING